ncbi:MAG: hypothetical protein KF688_00355 [Pirellulales bacterium]|nr:hypothetical protein [Pirellulales bacterium]
MSKYDSSRRAARDSRPSLEGVATAGLLGVILMSVGCGSFGPSGVAGRASTAGQAHEAKRLAANDPFPTPEQAGVK